MRYFTMLLSAILLIGWANAASAQCPAGQSEVIVIISPDNYPGESSWKLKDGSGAMLASGLINGDTLCVDTAECLVFTMSDSYGDGMCCAYGQGYYVVLLDGDTVAYGGDFDYEESTDFNCPPGTSCNSAEPIVEGTYTTDYDDHWYVFVPDSNGVYTVSTCSLNTCDTKVWIYDYCSGLSPDESNAGTIYYDSHNGGCGDQAQVSALLEAGVTYWIRIGDDNDDCTNDNVGWSISYNGPIAGCMDPTACNYAPLATIADTCYYFGDPNCPDGPDLTVLQDVIESSMYLTTIDNQDGCYIAEGCLAGYGVRDIVRFTTHIKNVGTSDYYIGIPSANPDQFTYDNCHGHYHYEGYAEYVLYDDDGNELPVGFKNGFCVMDLECNDGGTFQYGCSNMGISHQCGDIYSAGLACQWVDVTDLDTGRYMLVVRVNWDQSPDALGQIEPDYTNNWAQVCIRLSRDIQGTLSVNQETDCQPYVDCMGIQYGPNVPDCNGICAGTALHGDLDQSLQRDNMDTDNYIEQILDGSLTPSSCNDLNADGAITVTDAALLAHCNLVSDPNHDHCQFPSGLLNINDLSELTILDVNLIDQYVDVGIRNPDNRVVGYEFDMSGINIASVQNLADPTDFPETISFNPWEHKAVALSYVDSTVRKNTDFEPLCRIFYFGTPDNEICISNIVDIVNQDYEDVITGIVDGCYTVSTNGLDEIQAQVQFDIMPNPSDGVFNVNLRSASAGEFELSIVNSIGQQVENHRMPQGKVARLQLDLSDHPKGIYFATAKTATGTVTRKVVIQ